MGNKVRLFYVGGLEAKPTEKGDRRTRAFIVGSQVFTVPEIGGYIEIDEWAAKEAVSKFKADGFTPFTLSQGHAERLMKGLTNEVRSIDEYSEEELQAALEAKRGPKSEKKKSKPEPETVNSKVFDDEDVDLSHIIEEA